MKFVMTVTQNVRFININLNNFNSLFQLRNYLLPIYTILIQLFYKLKLNLKLYFTTNYSIFSRLIDVIMQIDHINRL